MPSNSASFITIPPFFEPGAPPPTLPILIAQTEVGIVDTPCKLLAQEEIGSGPTVARSARSSARYIPYSKSACKHALPSKPHNEGPDGDTSDSELTSINDSDSKSDHDDSHLIAKPDGEAGRPGRGGYNLEVALKWEHKKYLKVKVSDSYEYNATVYSYGQKYVKKLIEQYLEPQKNFISQSTSGIRVVQQMVCSYRHHIHVCLEILQTALQFPELRDYADLWPVMDMVRLNLKYTSGRARLNDIVSRELSKHVHKKR
jgi:hypothetical protein